MIPVVGHCHRPVSAGAGRRQRRQRPDGSCTPRPDPYLGHKGQGCITLSLMIKQLNLSPRIHSSCNTFRTIAAQIGGDGLGEGIIKELQAEGIDTSCVLRAAGRSSPFTYIIVDRAGERRRVPLPV